jgi:tetratricopeptide (TPR) repeat protein
MSKSLNSLKSFTLAGTFFLLPLIITAANPQLDLGTTAVAEEEKKEPKYKNVKTRQRQSVGAKCAKALEKVQVVLEEEENFPESLSMLEDIESSSETCKKPYEQTQIWKFKGYVYYSLDDLPGAIRSYRQVINGEGTPVDLRLDTRYLVAQLYVAEGRDADAAKELEIWMSESKIDGNNGEPKR